MSITGIASGLLSILSGSQNNRVSNPGQFEAEFQQLGQDLQSGNLQAPERDFSTLRGEARQTIGEVAAHSSGTAVNPIAQEFNQLARALQGGNLQAAQQAFMVLRNDFQQIGGFRAPGSASASSPVTGGGVDVTA